MIDLKEGLLPAWENLVIGPTMNEDGPRRLGLREDWASVPFLAFTGVGFVVSLYDFWTLQGPRFRKSAPLIIGIIFVIAGGALRVTSRRALMKAGFGLFNSSRLQIVEGQRLITDGV